MMFQLALALGMTVREIETKMDSREFSEWIAFTNIEPLPDPWLIGGQQCALMANMWTTGKRFRPEDFMPTVKPTKKQSNTEFKSRMNAIAAKQNAYIDQQQKRKEKRGG